MSGTILGESCLDTDQRKLQGTQRLLFCLRIYVTLKIVYMVVRMGEAHCQNLGEASSTCTITEYNGKIIRAAYLNVNY